MLGQAHAPISAIYPCRHHGPKPYIPGLNKLYNNPNIHVGFTQIGRYTRRHTAYIKICHKCGDTSYLHLNFCHTQIETNLSCAHTTHSPPLPAESHHSIPGTQLMYPAFPASCTPTSHLGCPSPGLLSCRMMARKKSWENMVLIPGPSCLYPPSSQPLQPGQLGSQPGAGLQRKAHPTPFSPGQSVCQARSSPARNSLGRDQDHQRRELPQGGEVRRKGGS